VYGKALDTYDLALAIENDDSVCANVALLQFLGGPMAVLAMEMTGFEEKLLTAQASGYSIPQVMRYGSEVASHILNPFSLGQPGPYSQMITLAGPSEPVLKPSKQWLDQVVEANEDARRRTRR
jgi:hypothetical protein